MRLLVCCCSVVSRQSAVARSHRESERESARESSVVPATCALWRRGSLRPGGRALYSGVFLHALFVLPLSSEFVPGLGRREMEVKPVQDASRTGGGATVACGRQVPADTG